MTEPRTPSSQISHPTQSGDLSKSTSAAISESASANREEVDFAKQANENAPGFLREFSDFLIEYRAWWLAPIVIVLLLLAGLVFLGGTAAAPLIYPIW
jgi:Family of unknown function (DUF5989)